MERKTKIKFTDFECNLLINGMSSETKLARTVSPQKMLTTALKNYQQIRKIRSDTMSDFIVQQQGSGVPDRNL